MLWNTMVLCSTRGSHWHRRSVPGVGLSMLALIIYMSLSLSFFYPLSLCLSRLPSPSSPPHLRVVGLLGVLDCLCLTTTVLGCALFLLSRISFARWSLRSTPSRHIIAVAAGVVGEGDAARKVKEVGFGALRCRFGCISRLEWASDNLHAKSGSPSSAHS